MSRSKLMIFLGAVLVFSGSISNVQAESHIPRDGAIRGSYEDCQDMLWGGPSFNVFGLTTTNIACTPSTPFTVLGYSISNLNRLKQAQVELIAPQAATAVISNKSSPLIADPSNDDSESKDAPAAAASIAATAK